MSWLVCMRRLTQPGPTQFRLSALATAKELVSQVILDSATVAVAGTGVP
jgi:hypothetical protein